MSEFVFEIGSEEMPARFVGQLSEELQRLMAAELLDARLDYARIFTAGTPRRQVLRVTGLAEAQRVEEQTFTGPPVKVAKDADGNLTKAGQGFARSQNVSEDQLFELTTDKGVYLAVTRKVGGAPTAELLPAICERVVRGLSFPKKMSWGSGDFTFGRPIRWFCAVLDATPITFELAGITAAAKTWGHRVMGPGPFSVANAADLETVLRDQCAVVLDPAERAQVVRERGTELAAAHDGTVVANEKLLGEVVNLVEHPVPILGRFHSDFLELPRQVLLTSMQNHQKSFGLEDASGKLLPYFLTVLNLVPEDLELVRKGWERVLKARLEDARFFWRADLAADFDSWLARLDAVTFVAGLGSMGAKALRLERLCSLLAERLDVPEVLELAQAGRYAKCDLVSEMVGEFDDLQGIMGGIYARQKGLSETVAQALGEQYLPEGPDSPVPASLPGAILALADKADTLAGCFGLAMQPSGGADPYALRRAALGICRIVMDKGLRLSLDELLTWAQEGYQDVEWKLQPAEAKGALLDFFAGRLKALFVGQGNETLVVEAALGGGFDDMAALSGRVAALDAFSRSSGAAEAFLTFKRAANIIRKQGPEVVKAAGVELSGAYDAGRFESEHERTLAQVLEATAPRFAAAMDAGDYATALGMLHELRPAVDGLFDNVMVMAEDLDLRVNRLNLLQALVAMLAGLADFNALQV